jgi:hypothetical protein
VHQNAASIVGIRHTLDVASLLKPVEHDCDAAGAEAGVFGQFPGRHWTQQLQNAKALQVREMESESVSDVLVVKNGACDELADIPD